MHVTKQTAVMLKEKGFDLETIPHYYEDDVLQTLHNTPHFSAFNWNGIGRISAPTLHKAADWLREAKGVHVSVVPVNLWQQWRMFIYLDTYPPQKTRLPEKPMDYKTYDLALEAGIIYALKHYVK